MIMKSYVHIPQYYHLSTLLLQLTNCEIKSTALFQYAFLFSSFFPPTNVEVFEIYRAVEGDITSG